MAAVGTGVPGPSGLIGLVRLSRATSLVAIIGIAVLLADGLNQLALAQRGGGTDSLVPCPLTQLVDLHLPPFGLRQIGGAGRVVTGHAVVVPTRRTSTPLRERPPSWAP